MYFIKNTWKVAVAIAFCSLAWAAAVPQGWFLAGSSPADYESGVDAREAYGGRPSAYMKSTKPQIDGFGTLMQQFQADEYVGKRIRFAAFVKTEAVLGSAGLWMRVDKGRESVAFDNMNSRAIKGTTPWQNYEVVLDVPADATGIAFGILLTGTGSTWINGATLDVVGTNVPTTGSGSGAQGPENLALEGSAAGTPRGWGLAGSKPTSYSTGVEAGSGAYLRSREPAVEGFGTLMQMFKANAYLGKRIRFSASVKATGVEKWSGLWMRVDKGTSSVAFDNMQGRPIRGSVDWHSYSVVLQVPQGATAIAFGILLEGAGEVRLKDVTFETVGPDVRTTEGSTPTGPTNLGFEK